MFNPKNPSPKLEQETTKWSPVSTLATSLLPSSPPPQHAAAATVILLKAHQIISLFSSRFCHFPIAVRIRSQVFNMPHKIVQGLAPSSPSDLIFSHHTYHTPGLCVSFLTGASHVSSTFPLQDLCIAFLECSSSQCPHGLLPQRYGQCHNR